MSDSRDSIYKGSSRHPKQHAIVKQKARFVCETGPNEHDFSGAFPIGRPTPETERNSIDKTITREPDAVDPLVAPPEVSAARDGFRKAA